MTILKKRLEVAFQKTDLTPNDYVLREDNQIFFLAPHSKVHQIKREINYVFNDYRNIVEERYHPYQLNLKSHQFWRLHKSPKQVRLIEEECQVYIQRNFLTPSATRPFRVQLGKLLVEVSKQNLLEVKADIIVNPSNSLLYHDGGVSLQIAKRAGQAFKDECEAIRKNPLSVGQSVITSGGGHLKFSHIIHAVGPKYQEDHTQDQFLKQAVISSLQLCEQHGKTSVAFPTLSAGEFGYPMKDSVKVNKQDSFLGAIWN